jgi:hypothetical protein
VHRIGYSSRKATLCVVGHTFRQARSLPPQQALQIVPKSMRRGCVALPTYGLCAVCLSTLRPRVAERVKETDGNVKPLNSRILREEAFTKASRR